MYLHHYKFIITSANSVEINKHHTIIELQYFSYVFKNYPFLILLYKKNITILHEIMVMQCAIRARILQAVSRWICKQ